MSDADLVSRVLAARYEVERLIGRGGMASVYLARDLRQDRRVAVKVLDPELASSITAERFLREISVAAKLAHPNVLPLHDSGEDGGLLYFVMPYVEGETLRDRLDREGALPLDEALRLGCEIAGALEYAHGQHILHRDIKPENVLLEQGHAVLADFGIARVLGGGVGDRLTATGISLGTPAYMSPEQATGESRIDARSDLYSLACVLYEMLAGEAPFTGPTAQSVIAKRLGGPPPRIRTVRPSVPERVESALLRAMDLTPADRFSSAGEFARALEACARDDGTSVWRRVRTARRAPVALAATLLAAAAAGMWALQDRAPSAAALPVVAVLPFTNQSPVAEHAYLADGLTNAVIEDLTRAAGFRVVSRSSAMRFRGGMSGMGAMQVDSTSAPATQGPMPGGMAFMESERGGGVSTAPVAAVERMGTMSQPTLRETSRALGADVLLQGTVTRSGDSVHVSATLIRAPSLEQVWRQTFTRHVRDLSALQGDLVDAVTRGVEGNAGAPSHVLDAAPRHYDPEAHEAYLKGAYFQAHRKLPQAVVEFERAVRSDSAHAPAQAGLARAYYYLSFFGELPPSVAVAAMRRAATAALASDSTLADAHAQMALVLMLQDWDWVRAERHFQRALELSPGHAAIRHDYAHFLLGQGRRRESVEQTRQSLALDPANPMLVACLGWHSLFDGRYVDANRHAVEANAMMPSHWSHVVHGWALLGQGKADSALVAVRAARGLDGSAFTLAALGHALAVSGRTAEARATLDSLLALSERQYVSPYDIATVYAGLGARDETFKWLRRAADDRSTFIVHVGWDARFDALRSDARFADLTAGQLRLPTPQFAALTAEGRRGY